MSQSELLPVISLTNVSIRLNSRLVFVNSSWEMKPGEHWIISGPTGCGKSLFASALCGSLPFVGGQTEYHFNDGTEYPEGKIIHVDFDSIRLMKTEENLFLQSRYWSCDESNTVNFILSENQIKEINPFEVTAKKVNSKKFTYFRKKIVSLLQIDNLLGTEIDHLSFGESKKVLLARALLKNPQILMLDNPLQGLDVNYKEYLLGTVLPAVALSGIQLIIITSDNTQIPQFMTNQMFIENLKIKKTEKFTPPQKKCKNSGIHNNSKVLKVITNPKRPEKSDKVLIDIKNLTYSAGKKILFSNLNWVVRKGENWLLHGPNGSGKTTLLSLISGDNPQMYAHDISIFGKRWGTANTNIWDTKKKIGWVSPELQSCFARTDTCFEVICSGFFDTIGLYKRVSKKMRLIAMEWIAKMNLTEYIDTPFCRVSEGVQRLTLLIRAMVKLPSLLILDEPCQGLDKKYQAMMLKTIDHVSKSGCTIVFVSHISGQIPKCITNELSLNKK